MKEREKCSQCSDLLCTASLVILTLFDMFDVSFDMLNTTRLVVHKMH